jgi:hypothetical protein
MKYLNRYTFFARYIPGLITIFPLTLLYFFLTKKYNDFELKEYFESVTFLLGISATFILTFFMSMVVREFGSFLEKKYFNNRRGFPTNYLMLYQNEELPDQTKVRYGDKINIDFDLKRLNEQEEKNNIDEAIKILNQASRIVSTKYQQNEQVKDANIAYGFSRNVSGGLLLSIPTSIAGIIVGSVLKENSLIFWSSVSSLIFVVLACFHKQWIVGSAEKYAEKLISVYLSDK